jgi:xylulose-5-phosphate/fructose-6-phosphate phosphoketolase
LCTQLIEHREYVRTNGEDLPEIRDWRWTGRHDPVTCGASPLKEPEA